MKSELASNMRAYKTQPDLGFSTGSDSWSPVEFHGKIPGCRMARIGHGVSSATFSNDCMSIIAGRYSIRTDRSILPTFRN